MARFHVKKFIKNCQLMQCLDMILSMYDLFNMCIITREFL